MPFWAVFNLTGRSQFLGLLFSQVTEIASPTSALCNRGWKLCRRLLFPGCCNTFPFGERIYHSAWKRTIECWLFVPNLHTCVLSLFQPQTVVQMVEDGSVWISCTILVCSQLNSSSFSLTSKNRPPFPTSSSVSDMSLLPVTRLLSHPRLPFHHCALWPSFSHSYEYLNRFDFLIFKMFLERC